MTFNTSVSWMIFGTAPNPEWVVCMDRHRNAWHLMEHYHDVVAYLTFSGCPWPYRPI
ncbi:MAG: hypothetical protein ACKVQU_34115 [Burkholderiales bacterium]